MDLKRKLRLLPCPLYQPVEAISREWSAAFAHEHEWGLWRFPVCTGNLNPDIVVMKAAKD
jgi:hypothetical protein